MMLTPWGPYEDSNKDWGDTLGAWEMFVSDSHPSGYQAHGCLGHPPAKNAGRKWRGIKGPILQLEKVRLGG